MDPRSHNRAAWNKKVDQRNRWRLPASSEAVEEARRGDARILLTSTKPVPIAWCPPLDGTRTAEQGDRNNCTTEPIGTHAQQVVSRLTDVCGNGHFS